MYDVVLLISNKRDCDWDKIYNVAKAKTDRTPAVMSISSEGIATCMFDFIEGSFYIINENLEAVSLMSKVNSIFDKHKDKSILIAVHKGAKEKINFKSSANLHWKLFHHEDSDLLWSDYLKPYIDAIADANDRVTIKDRFSKLCRFRAVDLANSLRAGILTPFIPLHLFNQIDIGEGASEDWKNIIDLCLKEISDNEDKEGLDNKLFRLLRLTDEKQTKKIENIIRELKQGMCLLCNMRKSDRLDYNHKIEDLAQELDSIVTLLENN